MTSRCRCLIIEIVFSAEDDFINCKIVEIPTKMVMSHVAWGFQKNSPFLPLFNNYLKKLDEKGAFQKLLQKFEPPSQVCPDGAGKPIGFSSSLTAFLSFGGKYIIIN